MAVLSSPGRCCYKGQRSTAVLLVPIVLLKSASVPTAVLLSAVLNNERSSADSGVETAVVLLLERTSQLLYFMAGGEAKKGVLPFCRVEPRIASVWRRDNACVLVAKAQSRGAECDEKW